MLNKQELFTQAMKAAERSAFVDQGFEPVLDRLLTALNTEASLNEVGTGFHSARLRDLLTNRLRMEAWFEKHPEILDELSSAHCCCGLAQNRHHDAASHHRDRQSLLAPIWSKLDSLCRLLMISSARMSVSASQRPRWPPC